MLIRRFFAFVISAFLIFFPAYSYAATSVGGWTALDTITAGANNTINAVKGAGATGMRSAVAVAPSAAKVGKNLIKGGGAAALAFAMVELLDAGVDWVLDPANNSVKYKPTAADDGTVDAFGTYTVIGGAGGNPSASNAQTACSMYVTAANQKNRFVSHNNPVATASVCNFGFRATTDKPFEPYSYPISFKPSADSGIDKDGYKHIPIGTVAAKVIANAEAGHAPSQEAVKATALEGFAAGEYDVGLDAAAVPDTGVENPPDTENPPTDAPVPFDPSSIIAAINSLKAMLAGILSSMTGFFDWVQAPVPPDDEEKKDVPFATTGDVGLDDVDRFEKRIEFSGQCPVNDFSFSMMGVTYAKPIPYYHLCGFLEQIAPWLLAMCYLGVAYFVVENI